MPSEDEGACGCGRDRGPGGLVRFLRVKRGLSREFVAARLGISVEYLTLLEQGRWTPDLATTRRLADQFELPLRLSNELMTRAGYPPPYPETPVGAPKMAAFRKLLDQVVHGHGPIPAMAVDRGGRLIAANEAADVILGTAACGKPAPPGEADPQQAERRRGDMWRLLRADMAEHLRRREGPHEDPPSRFSLCEITREGVSLTLLNVQTAFALPRDVTVEEITVQAFFPADTATALFLRCRLG